MPGKPTVGGGAGGQRRDLLTGAATVERALDASLARADSDFVWQTPISCIGRPPSFPPWQGGMKGGFRYAIPENWLVTGAKIRTDPGADRDEAAA